MEVVEIISHYINKSSNVLYVEFRIMQDDLDVFRKDIIEYHFLEEFGYIDETFEGFFDEEEDEWDWGNEDEDEYMDEDSLISFLNEYYIVKGNLPDAELG
jgi:hypothetical protein